MTIDEARESVGRAVLYRAPRGRNRFFQGDIPAAEPERGVIVSVNDKYVFVDFGQLSHPACTPETLELELP